VRSFHLTGSAVLRDWRPGASDLDFLAVLARPATDAEVRALRLAHARFARPPGAPHLDGPWLGPGELAQPPSPARPGLASSRGRLLEESSVHRDPVTWRTLARYGVALGGPDLAPGDVWDDEAELQTWLTGNLRGYWGRWAARGRSLATREGLVLLWPWGVVWTALGVARQLYTLRTGDIASKRWAGVWAAGAFPQWAEVLGEAVRLREGGEGRSAYPSALARRRAVLAFLGWATDPNASPDA